ncbi:hypothetical protein ACP4OV_019174 [Aristida adscensionis]
MGTSNGKQPFLLPQRHSHAVHLPISSSRDGAGSASTAMASTAVRFALTDVKNLETLGPGAPARRFLSNGARCRAPAQVWLASAWLLHAFMCMRRSGHEPLPKMVAACRSGRRRHRRARRPFNPKPPPSSSSLSVSSILGRRGRGCDPCARRVREIEDQTRPERLAMASSSGKAHRNNQHQHRAEAPAPATSVVVEEARAGEPPQQWERVRAQVRGAQAQQLRRSEAFPPRRTAVAHAHQPPRRRRLHKRCDSEINLSPQHRGFGEVAGGTAAGCAAVSCCFPAVMVEVAVLATVRAPAALARKAIRAGRGHRRAASAGQASEMYELVVDDVGEAAGADGEAAKKPQLEEEEQAEMEKEVWARFYGTGFWRSASQLTVTDEVR